MTNTSATHYTAVLEIQKTTVVPPPTDRYNSNPTGPASRNVAEVTRIVIRAETLEALTAKLTAHAALIEE